MSLSSSNRQIIFPLHRIVFDDECGRAEGLPQWTFIDLTRVKAETAIWFGSNLRKWMEPGTQCFSACFFIVLELT